MFAARNLRRHCLKFACSILQSNLSQNAISGHTSLHISSNIIQPYNEVAYHSYVKPSNSFNVSSRAMSTSKGRSMRSKVERRMQKESGKTLREIRRAKKLKKKLMTEEERLIYNLKRAKKKVALLLQKLKKYELPELPSPRHDPELLTAEQLQAYKKIGFRNKNYVPVGVRGVFGGVVQNMHLHWKFHETVQALFKARFEQALESQKLNIKQIEQKLRRMGVNPEDPTAMASIQRVASTFFNAIDKKEGSPYVFHEGKLSAKENVQDLEEPEPSTDSDQEELDRFIAEIEDAADKEYEAEEAKEKEEFGRIRYRNREEFGGRYRKFDAPGNDDYDGEIRGSRFRQTALAKQQASDSDVENNTFSDGDDDDDYDGKWPADPDSNSDESSEAKGRFKASKAEKEKRSNFGRSQVNGSFNTHEGKFRKNSSIVDSDSESTFSDLDNAMWESDEEENESSGQFSGSGNYKSNSGDKYAYHTKRDNRNGVRHHGAGGDDSDQNWDRFDVPKSMKGKQGGIGRVDINPRSMSLESGSEDIAIDSENRMWHSDSEEEFSHTWRVSGHEKRENDYRHKRSPKDGDEAWDSD
ncbi:CRM-domain containing factor CFM3, chloroplastic/mitochondrial isoform X2 [Neltuma alba]|uniref:CRM-domain containing factor CFM3, chloroplastic/mitochondrial isoform X2 n=1 Tax=Neltuma alba TaxID=207710 RepID=UPI0010A2FDEB|nr:CRM-domain containing factor CFM3, chloroplastic/mitochondrial isoform X2 [Prosopis alba]